MNIIDTKDAERIKLRRDGVSVTALLEDVPVGLKLTFKLPELEKLNQENYGIYEWQ